MKLQVKVEGEDTGTLFENLIKDLMMDLGISGAIESLKLLLNPFKLLFAFEVEVKPVSRLIRLGEVAEVTESHEGVRIKIADERFSPDIIRALESSYGKSVKHVSRLEVVIEESISRELIENMAICDYSEVVERSILELMRRVTPEGFRSIRVMRSKNKITLIASEDPLTDEMIEEAKLELSKL